MVTAAEISRALSTSLQKLMDLCSEDTVMKAVRMLKSRVKELAIPLHDRIKDLQTEEEILAVIEEMESELRQTE